jgi:hypothetical protein
MLIFWFILVAETRVNMLHDSFMLQITHSFFFFSVGSTGEG